jgi:hypothetical protein
MPIELSKTQVALALAAAATSFLVVGEIMHQSRASTIPVATVAASSTPASAAAMPAPSVDARQAGARGACREDMQRLCGSAAPGQGRMIQCLSERRSEVSQACRDALAQRRLDREHRRHSMNEGRSHRVQVAQNVGARQAWRERRTPGYTPSKSDGRQTSQQ